MKTAAGKSTESTVYVGAGSSIGKSANYIYRALRAVNSLKGVRITAVSPVYRSLPLGGVASNEFLNLVFELKTLLSPLDLFNHLKEIEKTIGRQERSRWADREIDLDIILFGELVINSSKLTVPHPGMMNRDFVLLPLLDVAPEIRHPLTGKLLKECRENLSERFILEESKKSILKIENNEVILIHE